MQTIRGTIIRFVVLIEKYSADLLLAAMLLAAAILPFRDPFMGEHEYHSPVILFGIGLILLAAARKHHDKAMIWLLFAVMAIRVVMLAGLYSPMSLGRIGEEGVTLVRAGMAVFFLGAIILLLTNHLWASRIRTEDSIKIAGSLYLMIGIEFANVHSLVYLMDKHSYHVGPDLLAATQNEHFHANHFSLFVYYSFSTLTTMGMGDILPMSRVARTLTWLEGITGQMFMVVLMSKVVNLCNSHQPASKSQG